MPVAQWGTPYQAQPLRLDPDDAQAAYLGDRIEIRILRDNGEAMSDGRGGNPDVVHIYPPTALGKLSSKQSPVSGHLLIDVQDCHLGHRVKRDQPSSRGLDVSGEKHADFQLGETHNRDRYMCRQTLRVERTTRFVSEEDRGVDNASQWRCVNHSR